MTAVQGFDYRIEDDSGLRMVQLTGEWDYYTAHPVLPSSTYDDHEIIVFDLAHVSFIDVGGLRRLLELRDGLRHEGKRVEFANPTKALMRLLDILDMDLSSSSV